MEEVEDILRELATFGASLEWRGGKLLCHTLPDRLLPASLQERIRRSKLRDHMRARRHRQQFDAPITAGQDSVTGDWFGLTPTQERIWAFCELWPENAFYNMPLALALHGPLEVAALVRAFECLVQRHPALRMVFAEADGVARQRVASEMPLQIAVTHIFGLDGQERKRRLDEIIDAESRRPFHLRSESVIRVRIIRLDNDSHVLALTLHHICADGWSVGVLLTEVADIYGRLVGGDNATLPSIRIGFEQYARWQNAYLAGEFLQEKLDFWVEELETALPLVKLPMEGKRSTIRRGGRERLTLKSELVDALNAFTGSAGVSLYCVIHAALAVVLQRWSGQQDLVIGTVTSGRFHPNTQGAVGCFMNSFAIRTKVAGNSTLESLAKSVAEALTGSYPFQDCPFDSVVRALKAGAKQGLNPVFNVALLLQNYPVPTRFSDGIEAAVIPTYAGGADLDLRYVAGELNGAFVVVCEYNAELFEVDTIRHTLKALAKTLEVLALQPDTAVEDLEHFGHLQQHASQHTNEPTATLRVAGNFNVDPVEDSLGYWLEGFTPTMRVSLASYGQAYQELLQLEAAGQEGDATAIFLRLGDWTGDPLLGAMGAMRTLRERCDEFHGVLSSQLSRSRRALVIIVCPTSELVEGPMAPVGCFFDVQREFVKSLEALPGVHVITPAEVFSAFGNFDYVEPHGFDIGHIPYTQEFYDALGTQVARKLAALHRPPFKVVAVDCDNTLWAGVCGELGADEVTLSDGHLRLQQFLLSVRDRGLLLCLCSKNNLNDVRAVFERPDMVLRWEHITAHRINWCSKSSNIFSLAQELRLGADAFIFLDDSAMECAEVSAAALGTCVLQLPVDPNEFESFLLSTWEFDVPVVSAEARRRAKMYAEESVRQAAGQVASNLSEFLRTLELRVEFSDVEAGNLERVAELTQRTNQFNLSNKRRSAQEINYACTQGELRAAAINVADRFGDYGLTGALLYSMQGACLVVDTFALSCRVLGRQVEHAVMQHLEEQAIAAGCTSLLLPYVQSEQNRPMFDFLNSFSAANVSVYDNTTDFKLAVSDSATARGAKHHGAGAA